jgi:hypothetical protein
MNTGLQDAYNLAWKLALVHCGLADESLLDSYHDERHPQGERLLRTTDRMFSVISGQSGLAKLVRSTFGPLVAQRLLTRESFLRWFLGVFAQLRISYPDSPLNREDGSGWHDAPKPGERAREADLLIQGTAGRIHDVLRGTHHTVLLFTGVDDGAQRAVELCRVAEQLEHTYPGLVLARVISAERFADHPTELADPDRAAHRRWGVEAAAAFVIRPDAYLGYRGRPVHADTLAADLVTRLPGRSVTPAA